nr:WYL domain-containing protein [Treponema sp.]
PSVKKTLSDILDEIANIYLESFSESFMPEESTVRKKLNEYIRLGLIKSEKNGRILLYSRAASLKSSFLKELSDAISFFSETQPCGVIGSFLLDKLSKEENISCDVFEYKHHYINSAIEDDFLQVTFDAIHEHRALILRQKKNGRKREFPLKVVPLMVYESTMDGRLYLMSYDKRARGFVSLRFDYIVSLEAGDIYENYEQKRAEFEKIRKFIWGVSTRQIKKQFNAETVHVSFTVHFEKHETFIYQRMLREKRCGEVTLIDESNARFDADIYDPVEIFPWVRTFICRITSFSCSDASVTKRFYADIRKMKNLYFDEKEDEADVIQ